MSRVVRSITRVGYQKIAKPLMFRRHPDTVHEAIASLGKKTQRTPVIRALPRLWAYQHKPLLRQRLHGIEFSNPIGLSAGFDKEAELAPLMKSIGMGYMIAGSVTAKACEGNRRPWYHRLPKLRSLIVHAGLPSSGVKQVKRTITAYPKKLFRHFPLSVSVAKTNSPDTARSRQGIEDYVATLTSLRRTANIGLFEINISCPNAYGGEPFTTPEQLHALLKAIDKVGSKKPIFVKMPIDLSWTKFEALLKVIVQHDIAGVTIGNLRKDRKGLEIATDAPAGGLSGAPTRERCNELIRKTYRTYGDTLTIIGVGGVFSAEDAYEKISAGASLVAMITGMIYEGPQVVGEINYGLKLLLERDGFSNISQVVGRDA